jgi:hypothetical protein
MGPNREAANTDAEDRRVVPQTDDEAGCFCCFLQQIISQRRAVFRGNPRSRIMPASGGTAGCWLIRRCFPLFLEPAPIAKAALPATALGERLSRYRIPQRYHKLRLLSI